MFMHYFQNMSASIGLRPQPTDSHRGTALDSAGDGPKHPNFLTHERHPAGANRRVDGGNVKIDTTASSADSVMWKTGSHYTLC